MLILTVFEEELGKVFSRVVLPSRRDNRTELLGDLGRVGVSRNVCAQSIDGRQRVVVLEIVHEVISDRRDWRLVDFDMVVNDFCLQIGNVGDKRGGVADSGRSHSARG